MKYRVTILSDAQRDVEAIFAWLAGYSPTGAARWYAAFVSAAESLSTEPLWHTRAPEASQRRTDLYQCFFRTPRGRKYRLIYVVIDDNVRVLRVRGPGQAPIRKPNI